MCDDLAWATEARDGKKTIATVRGLWLPSRGCYVICDVAVCSWCEQHDSREYLSGASNKLPGRHQIQNAEGPVLVPCAKQIYFRRDLKVDPLRIESGPSWQACFWSLHFVRCAEALQAAMCAKFQAWSYPHTNSIRSRNLELGRPVFTFLVFLVFKVQKNRPLFVTGRSKSRPDATLDP